MKNNYNIEKILDSFYDKGYTNFLTLKELSYLKGKLNKNEYHIHKLYSESDKVIIYKKQLPSITLFKIEGSSSLRHQDILGTIFSLGLKEDTFGDIIRYQDSFYIFILSHLKDYLKYNLTNIKKNKIDLVEVDLSLSIKFKQNYLKKEYLVTSLRLDNIISTITNESRNNVITRFKNNEIILNYDDSPKPTRVIKEQDIFSIRKIGKFKFNQILKQTKKGSYYIEILKYI